MIEITVAYYLGIDGGGSKTACIVGDETSVLATVIAGPSNITRVGEARARESLHEAIHQGCATASIDPREVKRACIGVAGAGREEIAGVVRKIVTEVIAAEIEVVGDMQIALQAALGVGPGVIVIAGTGSIAYGRDAQGRTARAGGLGFAVSDEGSGHWIGHAAVAALLRTADQNDLVFNEQAQQDSPLFCELKAIWNLESLEQLVRIANSHPDFAALLPAVLAAAETGDIAIQQILAQAGRELARLAGIVAHRLFPAQHYPAPSAVPLAMIGGVFRHSQLVRERFSDEVRQLYARLEVNPKVIEPVAGALQMARQAGR